MDQSPLFLLMRGLALTRRPDLAPRWPESARRSRSGTIAAPCSAGRTDAKGTRMNEATRRSFDMAEALANMAGVLLRVRDTGLLSQLIVNESCRMFHTPAAILQRLGPLPKSVRRVAVSEEAASEADAHLSLAEGMEIVGLETGEPTPFTTADLLADPRIPSEPGMRVLVERALVPGRPLGPAGARSRRGRTPRSAGPSGTDLHEGGGPLCPACGPASGPRARERGAARGGRPARRRDGSRAGRGGHGDSVEGCVSRDAIARAAESSHGDPRVGSDASGGAVGQAQDRTRAPGHRAECASSVAARRRSPRRLAHHRRQDGARPSRVGPPAVDRGSRRVAQASGRGEGRPPGARRRAYPHPRARRPAAPVSSGREPRVERHQVHARTRTGARSPPATRGEREDHA